MTIPTGTDFLITVAAQIPIVVLFVWFALNQQKIFVASQEKRDEGWRLFLDEQRKANNDVINRIADEVRMTGVAVISVQTSMQSHDQSSRDSFNQVQRISDKLDLK